MTWHLHGFPDKFPLIFRHLKGFPFLFAVINHGPSFNLALGTRTLL